MTTTWTIPFNKPTRVGDELAAVAAVLDSRHWAGDGEATKRCHAVFEQALGVGKALLTTSCTHALEMSALLLDLQPGDEVVLPSFTFVSTANAFALRGARLVFADVRPDTLNLDERQLPALLTERTRAVVVVHYAGIGCELDAIGALCRERGIALIEDNAHGLFGSYGGKPLGSFGELATLSFHETKNFSCGEGGALLINDPALIERAEIVREKGTNRSRFFRGQVDKYTWVDLGSSYLPAELLAAVLERQLAARERVQARREAIWRRYHQELAEWAAQHGIVQPTLPAGCDPAWHLYYLLLPSLEARTAFIAHLRAAGMLAVFHYLPLHLSPMGVAMGGKAGDCPVTEDISDRLVRLPFFTGMMEAEQDAVIARTISFIPPPADGSDRRG